MTLAMTTKSGGESGISRVGSMRFKLESAEEKPGRPARSKKTLLNLGHGRWYSQSPRPRFKRVFAPLFSKSGLFLIKLKHMML
jgi:hypothetical protein